MVPSTAAARVKVVKWGNSQAVRLPKDVLKLARLREGDELTVRVENGRIALEAATPEITLEKLSGQQVGHEQAGWRPAVVLSPKAYNNRSGLAIVVPVTNAIKGYPFEVDLPAGLKITGTVLSDAVRSIDWRHRQARYFDKAPAEVVKAARAKLAALIGIAQP